ncbi:patatin-like phospholipase family protein [Wolbachia endosymbiont (group A) of Gymnosoma rotundatum]|uniref:patatin-like phospholipase family protein n=1 Tax=Wolbachia endosymbiont (group A) of Gymnosoma rotundatum TaxID=2954016 RepID=UPI00222805EC|nr:patatin-like phospholipase family protein [Wolbachia endosymbiont (group A) of Gymnosoma rotundatum]
MAKYILSVDGGGIRGIIPAIILAEIESRTKKPISQIFDLMAGTSTGGIIVAGLCKSNKPQYSANDLVGLYQEYGAYIFQSSFWRKSIASWLSGSQYSYRNMEFILNKYFGESTMADVASNLLLTSYDIHNNCPFFFKSWREDRNFIKLKEALRATTAAPTYFTPKRLKIDQTDKLLVDGGVFANNPAACAYASGKRLFPNDDIVLLSIGTGRTDRSIANSRRLGKISWIKPLLHVMFSSSLDAVNYQLDQVIADKYIRIQSQLKIASPDMDNITSKNIKSLQQEANAMIEDNQEAIDRFCNIEL